MSEVTIIGSYLAKRVFQLHGAGNDTLVAFRKRCLCGRPAVCLRRGRF